MAHRLLEYVVAFGPPIWALAGLGALSALLALVALVWPRRRGCLVGGALCFIAALAWSGWLATRAVAAPLAELFYREGDPLVRAQLDYLTQRLALPIERHTLVVRLASLIALIVVPLWTLAALRSRRRTGRVVLAACAAALPLFALACAAQIYIDSISTSGSAPMNPVDRSPDIARMWSTLDALRTGVLLAGLVAAAVGSLAAVAAARAGDVVGAPALRRALAVFVVGAALFLATRPHAADTAAGPRRAFVGAPFKPFGDVTLDWTHPDAVTPPSAEPCRLVVDADEDRISLVLTAEAQLIDRYDEPWLEARGAEAWEQRLRETINVRRALADHFSRPFTPIVEAAIDRDAPLTRVLPFLELVAAHGIDEIVVVSRRSVVESSRTLGDVRVDKLCTLGSLKIEPGFTLLDDLGTWEDIARAAAAQPPAPLVLGPGPRAERRSAVAEHVYDLVPAGRFVTPSRPPAR